MDTIRDVVERFIRKGIEARLAKLREMKAPAIMLAAVEKSLAGRVSDRVAKIEQFGDRPVQSHITRVYRRNNGIEFTTEAGLVWLIPGPHGWFLTNKASK